MDDQFRPVRQTELSETRFIPSRWGYPESYELSISLPVNDPARYVIVLTTSDALTQRVRTGNTSQTYVVTGVYVPVRGGPEFHHNGSTGRIKLVAKPM